VLSSMPDCAFQACCRSLFMHESDMSTLVAYVPSCTLCVIA
jgi:hypothetical protein